MRVGLRDRITHQPTELMTLLTELVDQQGLTVVLVTHEPEVAAYARRTVRMRDGRIVEDTGRESGSTEPDRAAEELAR